MIKNVLLIYPPARLNSKALFGLPPLGLLYISAYLNQHKVNTYVFDGEIQLFSYQDLRDIIIKKNINLIGFNVMTVFLNAVTQLAAKLKSEFTDIPIVLGGPHISGTKEEMLEHDKNIDYLVYGEGEEALLNLIQRLNNNMTLAEVPNLIHRLNNDIVVNKPQKFITDLDLLPFPELSHIINFRPKLYNVPYSLAQTASIITSRGCPFNCNFCSAYIIHGHKWRNRSIENIIEELKYNYHKYSIRYFVIKDSLFTKDKEWTSQFCEEVLRSGLKVNFRCNTRVDCVDETLLTQMRKCGFDLINFGIESGNEDILNTINKKINKDYAIEIFKLAKKQKIKTHATFMIGNINETIQSIKDSTDFAKKLNPFFIRFFPAIAYPGTQLYNYAVENNLVNKDWYFANNYQNTTNERYLFPEYNSGILLFKDFDPNKMARSAFWRFYLRPRIFFRFLRMMIFNRSYCINLLRASKALMKYLLGVTYKKQF
jgi:anaerobic magnesium-protoporphyrin IX monomethyl ester cyclase